MRFRLRTLLVAFLLLCVSAPWWPDIYYGVKTWISRIRRGPPNHVSEQDLMRLGIQVRTGMTISQIDGLFGFKSNVYPTPRSFLAPGSAGRVEAVWSFRVHGAKYQRIYFLGEFESGRLIDGFDYWDEGTIKRWGAMKGWSAMAGSAKP